MWARITSNELGAKVLRIVLIFSLVFWASFRVECLAFAEMFVDDGKSHEGRVLSNFDVWELDKENPNKKGELVRDALLTADNIQQAKDFKISANGGQTQFVAVPLWVEAGTQPENPDSPVTPTEPDNPVTPTEPDTPVTPTNPDNPVTPTNPEDPATPTDPEGTENGNGNGTEGSGTVGTQSAEGPVAETRGVAPQAIQAQAEDDVYIANFVEWSVDDDSIATIESNESGVALLTGKKAGTVTVTCRLKSDFDMKLVSEELVNAFKDSKDDEGKKDETVRVTFKVDVVAPYANALEIHQPPYPNDTACDDNQEIVLTDEECASYAFWARVSVFDEATGETKAFDSTPEKGLSEATGGMLSDLQWAVTDKDGKAVDDSVATIANGVLTLNDKNAIVKVHCTVEKSLNDDEHTSQVIVMTEAGKQQQEKEAIQGEPHPQDKLTVTIERPASANSGEEGGSGAEGQQGQQDQNGQQDQGGQNSPEGGSVDTQDDKTGEPEAGNEGEPAAEEQPSADSGDSQPKTDVTTKEFSVEDIEGFANDEKAERSTYTMGPMSIDGIGPSLFFVLQNAGMSTDEQKTIESFEFVNYRDEHTTVTWSELTANTSQYPIVALRSYVNGDSESGAPAESGAAEGATGENAPAGDSQNTPATDEGTSSPAAADAGKPELLDNTRFRILFDTTGVDADSLRYINQVIVHVKGETKPEPEPEPEPEVDPTLRVSIDYVPVPKGEEAFLSAVPNQAIGSARFGFKWQRSVDKGQTWTDYSGDSIQTLRVKTDDDHIGNWFRVILETDMVKESSKKSDSEKSSGESAEASSGASQSEDTSKGESGGDSGSGDSATKDEPEYRTATSEPVEIVVGDDFGVVLDYIPPIAGDYANFTSHLVNAGGIDTSKVEYVWEQSEDGGATWTTIPGFTGATMRVPTNPVSENASSNSSGDNATPIVYIHVRVITADGKKATSNAQPLTVRVGENTDTAKENDINNAINSEQAGTGSGTGSTTGTKKSKKKVKEVNSPIVEESSSSRMSDYLDGTDDFDDDEPIEATDPTVAGDSPEIIIDKTVSEKINKQNETVKEKADSNMPGARWTELKTLNPTDDDVKRIFADNPFAPFAIPMSLGIIFAGGIERVLSFRRQL